MSFVNPDWSGQTHATVEEAIEQLKLYPELWPVPGILSEGEAPWVPFVAIMKEGLGVWGLFLEDDDNVREKISGIESLLLARELVFQLESFPPESTLSLVEMKNPVPYHFMDSATAWIHLAIREDEAIVLQVSHPAVWQHDAL